MNIKIKCLTIALLLSSMMTHANPGYENWATNTFTSGNQISDGTALPLTDADNDGIANLVEYTFNLDPLDTNSNGPLIEITPLNGAAVIQYNRRNAVASNQVELEFSDDLINWRPAISGLDYFESVIETHADYKRIQLNLTGLTGVAAFARTKIHLEPNLTDRPNIIMLFSDDQVDNSFGAMGHPWAQTPHVDSLINNGVHFSNTYVAEPICAPSRVSLFTGMHERVHGVGFTSRYGVTEEMWEKSYPALLRDDGYYTGFIGKFGVDYYNFNARSKFDYWFAHDGWASFFPKASHNCQIYTNASNDIITQIMGESMIDFLATAPANKPFCLQVSFSTPHKNATASMRPYYDINLPGVALPASGRQEIKDWEKATGNLFYTMLYRDPNTDHTTGTPSAEVMASVPNPVLDPYQYIPQHIINQDYGRQSLYSFNYSVGSNTEHRVRYYQCVTGIDDVIGDLVEELERKGLDENTVILYGSDNGLLMGDYGMGGKSLLYDKASKIPCFIYDPRQPQSARGQVRTELTSSLDLTSTILELAGVSQPEEMEGTSLMPLVANAGTLENRDHLFIESLYTGRNNPFCEGIRKGKWKYIRMFLHSKQSAINNYNAQYDESEVDFTGRTPDFEQLFDLDADPGEENNLVNNGADPTVLSELRTLCQAESDAINLLRADYVNTYSVTQGNRDRPTVFAAFTAKPTFGGGPLTVYFNGNRSAVGSSGQNITSYEWDFTSDGTIDATGVSTSFVYQTYGVHSPTLIVTDNLGVKSTNVLSITVVDPSTITNETAISGVIDLTVEAAASSGGVFGTTVANLTSDTFSYDFNNPTSPLPNQSVTDQCFLFESGQGKDGIVVFSLVDGAATLSAGNHLFVDIYGRSNLGDRSQNMDVELYHGGINGTLMGSARGLATSGSAIHVRASIIPTGPVDTIKLIGKGDGVTKNNFDISEVRASTDQ